MHWPAPASSQAFALAPVSCSPSSSRSRCRHCSARQALWRGSPRWWATFLMRFSCRCERPQRAKRLLWRQVELLGVPSAG